MSSRECQSLFLSLFFKDHIETAQAVVTNVRTNGFWVYVPKFDMRGPVFLSDMDGNIQIDPAFFGLEPTAGLEPTSGFAASEVNRRFPSGKCHIMKDKAGDEYLTVTVAESKANFSVRTLDVLTIQIMCQDWDVRARVPAPRLHLLSSSNSWKYLSAKAEHGIGSGTIRAQPQSNEEAITTIKGNTPKKANPSTVYEELSKMPIHPVLEGVPIRSRQNGSYTAPDETATSILIPGRIIFGSFVNPDTRTATQDAAIEAASEAAAKRRVQVMAKIAKDNEYNTTRQIEREATARAQRLAANKRHAKRNKGK